MAPTGLFCTYSQCSGEIVCVNNTTSQPYACGKGYSGNGEGKNNPNMQGVPFMGPIPQGWWVVGGPSSGSNTGPDTRYLTPLPGNGVFDVPRDPNSFWMHGDNPNSQGNASTGCIVQPPEVRGAIPPGETIFVTQ